MTLADLELREEKFDLAKVKFLECLHSAWGKNTQVESFCLEKLADFRAWPISEWQSIWPMIYIGHACKYQDKLALHKALLFVGDIFMANKDKETAANLYIVALEGFTFMDVHSSRVQCMLHLGDLANRQGHASKAIALWKTASPLFEQSSQEKDVAQIDVRLLTVGKAHQRTLIELVSLHAPEVKDAVCKDSKEEPLPIAI
ncbi:hypothetical protein DFH08DRAFT_803810 [Mycena albidolilacea]|uniref:Uncharacterized protein n=1 Tax=Mycena albidolilacea TaxID=1033008 RepID=A0AAD7EX49_9AGAR|nr:hypothetical protein DFH08DRAFT_803810 [Mycena albidolilacea]